VTSFLAEKTLQFRSQLPPNCVQIAQKNGTDLCALHGSKFRCTISRFHHESDERFIGPKDLHTPAPALPAGRFVQEKNDALCDSEYLRLVKFETFELNARYDLSTFQVLHI
jgi:hypothetical protein